MFTTHTNHVELLPNEGWDERILVCANPPLVNVFIVLTHRYVVVVDTLINSVTAQRLADIATPFLTKQRRLIVVNTHADYDHTYGNRHFATRGGAQATAIIGHDLCPERMDNRDAREILRMRQVMEPDIFGGVRITVPTLVFFEQMAIVGGDLTLVLLHTPGHTPDHISVYIPEIQTLLAGDAAEWPFPMTAEAADLATMRDSLAQLAALRPRRALYCHAPTLCGPTLLEVNQAYFATVEAACRAALVSGKRLDLKDDQRLIKQVGCPVEDALITPDGWPAPDNEKLVAGHAYQLRTMLTWLRNHQKARFR